MYLHTWDLITGTRKDTNLRESVVVVLFTRVNEWPVSGGQAQRLKEEFWPTSFLI